MPIRFAGLDWLRLAAAALVLFAHGGSLLFPLLPSYRPYFLSGLIGVELFFALSGFLLVDWLLRSPPAGSAAAVSSGFARLRRMMPLFLLFLLLNGLLYIWLQQALPERFWAYPLLMQNTVGLHPGFFGEAWNLPLLILFSLLAPWAVMAASRAAAPGQRLMLLLLAWIVVGMIVRAIVALQSPEWDPGIRKFLPARLDACAYGGLLACWWRMRPSSSAIRVAAIAGVVLLLLASAWFWRLSGSAAVSDCALFTLLGLACALPLPWLCRGESSRSLSFASRATWVLYFINMPLLLIGMRFGVESLGAALAFIVWIAAALLLTLILARPLLAFGQRNSAT